MYVDLARPPAKGLLVPFPIEFAGNSHIVIHHHQDVDVGIACNLLTRPRSVCDYCAERFAELAGQAGRNRCARSYRVRYRRRKSPGAKLVERKPRLLRGLAQLGVQTPVDSQKKATRRAAPLPFRVSGTTHSELMISRLLAKPAVLRGSQMSLVNPDSCVYRDTSRSRILFSTGAAEAP